MGKWLSLFFIFLLFTTSVFGGSVEERSMQHTRITSKECLEVLEKGNVLSQNGQNFFRIIYKGYSYIVNVKYMGSVRNFKCDEKMKLIAN